MISHLPQPQRKLFARLFESRNSFVPRDDLLEATGLSRNRLSEMASTLRFNMANMGMPYELRSAYGHGYGLFEVEEEAEGMTRVEIRNLLARAGYSKATASAAADVYFQVLRVIKTGRMAAPLPGIEG